jgi:NAD(P) transhydrogenase subunit alpha
MRIGLPLSPDNAERRVLLTPESVADYLALGHTVAVAQGAGRPAGFPDADYATAGAAVVTDDEVWANADVVLSLTPPDAPRAAMVHEGAIVVTWLDADETSPVVGALAARKASLVAIEAVPRITRAQAMDVRSSMANLAGYRAVLEAAIRFPRTLGAQVTAAGTTPPAKVLIIGAGVAGLAAVGAARALGAEVRAFDTRAACKEQVESLGAGFLTVDVEESGEGAGGYGKEMSQAFLDAEMALFRAQAAEVDVVITTALIPNKPAPKLWMADALAAMRPGSVVVDLAASRGGNCTATRPGEVVAVDGVTVVGLEDLTQAMADHASRLLARNVRRLIALLGQGDDAKLSRDDVILRGVTVLADGEVRWPAPPPEPSPVPPAPPAAAAAPTPSGAVATPGPRPSTPKSGAKAGGHGHAAPPASTASVLVAASLAAAAAIPIGMYAPEAFRRHVTVFVLACFLGWQVVWNVAPALHTPLMAVTNAISGIIVVGGLLQLSGDGVIGPALGFMAVALASVNIFGGFAVTRRMLAMFQAGGRS